MSRRVPGLGRPLNASAAQLERLHGANEARVAECAARDYATAQQILADPPRVPEAWLEVCRERAGDKFSSWPELAERMGLSFSACYGRWRRLMEATGNRRPRPPRPRADLEFPEPLLANREPPGPPEWLAEYRSYLAGGYSPSRGTARFYPEDEVAS